MFVGLVMGIIAGYVIGHWGWPFIESGSGGIAPSSGGADETPVKSLPFFDSPYNFMAWRQPNFDPISVALPDPYKNYRIALAWNWFIQLLLAVGSFFIPIFENTEPRQR